MCKIIGKTGLGRRAFVAEKKSEGKAQEAVKFSDFRSRKQVSLSQSRVRSDLRKSQLSCQRLDASHGLDAPLMRWYWPEEAIPQTEDTDDCSDKDEDLDIEVRVSLMIVSISCCFIPVHYSLQNNWKASLRIFVPVTFIVCGVEQHIKVWSKVESTFWGIAFGGCFLFLSVFNLFTNSTLVTVLSDCLDSTFFLLCR